MNFELAPAVVGFTSGVCHADAEFIRHVQELQTRIPTGQRVIVIDREPTDYKPVDCAQGGEVRTIFRIGEVVLIRLKSSGGRVRIVVDECLPQRRN